MMNMMNSMLMMFIFGCQLLLLVKWIGSVLFQCLNHCFSSCARLAGGDSRSVKNLPNKKSVDDQDKVVATNED